MNKIKAKSTAYEQFSPWEQSFINLVHNFDPSRLTKSKPLRQHYLTIDCCKGHNHDKIISSKREQGRSLLNPSKINLKNSKGDDLQQELIIQQKSSRYEGPRITFYSKMNPKCFRDSSIKNDKIKLRQSYEKFQFPSLNRNQSIKYLDSQECPEVRNRQSICLQSIYPFNTEDKKPILNRKQDDYRNMRRFKIIFNKRKISNNQ